jgi:hypothetical protein
LGDAVKIVRGANEKPLAGNRHGSLRFFQERITREHFKSGTRLDDRRFAFLGEEINFAIDPHGRGRMIPADAFLPDDFAVVRLQAGRHAPVGDAEKIVVRKEHGRNRRHALFLFPNDGWLLVFRGRTDRANGGFFESRDAVNEILAQDDGGDDAFALAIDGPQTFPIRQIKRLDDIARAADEQIPAIARKNIRRNMRDAALSAPGFPADLARLRIEREEIRLIPGKLPADALVLAGAAAVKGHDQQIAVQNGRRAEAMLAVELHLAVLPKRLARIGFQRDHAAIAEHGKNSFAIGGGSGGGVGVAAFLAQGNLLENIFIPLNRAGLAIEAQDMALHARARGGGDKNTIIKNDGRGPRFTGNRGFPGDVLLVRPFEGRGGFLRHALARGSAPKGPVFRGERLRAKSAGQGNDAEESHWWNGFNMLLADGKKLDDAVLELRSAQGTIRNAGDLEVASQ